jgi:hypothetical protein
MAKEIGDKGAAGDVGGMAGTDGLGEIVGPPEGISPRDHPTTTKQCPPRGHSSPTWQC